MGVPRFELAENTNFVGWASVNGKQGAQPFETAMPRVASHERGLEPSVNQSFVVGNNTFNPQVG